MKIGNIYRLGQSYQRFPAKQTYCLKLFFSTCLFKLRVRLVYVTLCPLPGNLHDLAHPFLEMPDFHYIMYIPNHKIWQARWKSDGLHSMAYLNQWDKQGNYFITLLGYNDLTVFGISYKNLTEG